MFLNFRSLELIRLLFLRIIASFFSWSKSFRSKVSASKAYVLGKNYLLELDFWSLFRDCIVVCRRLESWWPLLVFFLLTVISETTDLVSMRLGAFASLTDTLSMQNFPQRILSRFWEETVYSEQVLVRLCSGCYWPLWMLL